ncbi:MAG: rod shape-determining protein MreC [Planctomycetaceae bacterium]
MQSSVRNLWLNCSGVILLALLTAAADRTNNLTGVRTTLHDAISPGRFAVLAISSVPGRSDVPHEELAALQDELRQNEIQRRHLLIENARLRNQLQTSSRNAEAAVIAGPSLLQYRAVDAGVLSGNGMPDRLNGLFIDVGKSAGLRRSELVLDGSGILIDKGRSDALRPGDQALSGRTVVGRIEKTGRWVSLIQPVTSSQFTARIQVVRQSEQGVYFGAIGLLTGDDNGGCVVTGIPYTESVTAGDSVFSADIEGVKGPRLFFGTVTRADFLSGGEWSITVKPATDVSQVDRVSVLQAELSEEQLARSP